MTAQPVGAATVRELALLCKLELEDAEVERLGHELAAVLQWVDGLWPAGSSPHHAPLSADRYAALRLDEPGPMLPHEVALALAPEPREGAFAVPRIVEG